MKLKQNQYPDKTTVNLIVREQKPGRSRGRVSFIWPSPWACLQIWGDNGSPLPPRPSARRRANSSWSSSAWQCRLRSGPGQYQRYFSQELADGQPLSADCMEVLSLLENTIMSGADVSSVSFSGTTLTVRLTGVGLNGTSDILAALSQSSLVTGVDLSTADDDAGGSAVSMTVACRQKGENAHDEPKIYRPGKGASLVLAILLVCSGYYILVDQPVSSHHSGQPNCGRRMPSLSS